MNATKRGGYAVCFEIDIDSLAELDRILRPYSTAIKFAVSLSDGTTVYPQAIAELARMPNTVSGRIVSIKIENDFGDRVRTDITLDSDGFFQSIPYNLSGEDADVLVLDHALRDWVHTIKRRYTWLSFTTFLTMSFWAGVLIIGLELGFINLTTNYFGNHRSVVAIVAVMLIILAVSAGRLRERLFPKGQFAIGAGKERIQNLRELRKRLSFFGLVLALMTGLISAWIRKLLGF
jgi:uncharacterized membrane protein